MGAALFIAHPAHELRLHAWLSRTRAEVHVLTTGSRSGEGTERLEATGRLLDGLGCPRGRVFGACLDRELYAALLAGEHAGFHAVADALRDALAVRAAGLLVVDAWQLYSPAHDLAHLIGRAAAAEAGVLLGRPVDVRELAVVPEPAGHAADSLVLRLSVAEAEARRAAADAHPGIEAELAEALAVGGAEALAAEAMCRPPPLAELPPSDGQPPLYERFGEARVRSGLYGEVLRWRHMAPVFDAFARRIGEAGELAPARRAG